MRERVVVCFGDVVKYCEPHIAYEHEVVVVANVVPSGGEISDRSVGVTRDAFSYTPVSSAVVVYLTCAGVV
jgi:hypothetical protein